MPPSKSRTSSTVNFDIVKILIPVAVVAAMTGCLDAGQPTATMCQETEDCRGNQICDDGVCWGDPPDTSTFAVVLIPPADRSDLAPTELVEIAISQDGTIAGLEFGASVWIHGRIVLACDDDDIEPCQTLVPGQVIVERDSSFKGGPGYRRTTTNNTEAGEEEDSFGIRIPADGAEYRVTVVPDEASLESLAVGGTQIQAPPFSTTIVTNEDLEVAWELGRPEQLKSIEGCVTSTTGNGSNFGGMHMTALGRWTLRAPLTRASAVVTTDEDGCFSLSVPRGMRDEFDIVAKPAPGVTLPTLRLSGEFVPDPLEGDDTPYPLAPLRMPNAANPVTFKLPIMGLSSGGGLEPVSGATVQFETLFPKTDGEKRDVQIRFVAQVTSNGIGEQEPGVARVALYPGSIDFNRTYHVRALPPPDSQYASLFDSTIEVGTGDGAPVLPTLNLNRRVAVTGTITRYDGMGLANSPLTVRPTPVFREKLATPDERITLDNLQFPSDLTGDSGDFLLWLDPELLGTAARYDFMVAPPDYSSAPPWAFEDLTLNSTAGTTVDLGDLQLPPASYARGQVRDPEGQLLPGAEIRWFQLPASDSCEQAGLAQDCRIPAHLLGIWESDADGQVVAVLPDP